MQLSEFQRVLEKLFVEADRADNIKQKLMFLYSVIGFVVELADDIQFLQGRKFTRGELRIIQLIENDARDAISLLKPIIRVK